MVEIENTLDYYYYFYYYMLFVCIIIINTIDKYTVTLFIVYQKNLLVKNTQKYTNYIENLLVNTLHRIAFIIDGFKPLSTIKEVHYKESRCVNEKACSLSSSCTHSHSIHRIVNEWILIANATNIPMLLFQCLDLTLLLWSINNTRREI